MVLAVDTGMDTGIGGDGSGGGGDGGLSLRTVAAFRLNDLLRNGLREGRSGGTGRREGRHSSQKWVGCCKVELQRFERGLPSMPCPTSARSEALDLLLTSSSIILLGMRFMEEGSRM